MSDAEFLHKLTPAASDALEDTGEPRSYPAGTVVSRALLEPLSRRLREAEARRVG